jgi:glycosyltransferase involved in cell wall biosynthesis
MRPGVLLIGNFLSGAGLSRGVCEDLAEHLSRGGWCIATTSSRPGRLARLRDMLATVWRERGSYDVAQVDVYSGPAFLWAEAVCRTLRWLGRPYVLTLHGGNLPNFARRWPRRVRRVLTGAAAVTTPSPYLQARMRPFREDLLLLPNALDVARYPFRLRTHALPRLIWLRAFHQIYNPSMAARVVALLARDVPDVQLTMIGPDKGDRSREATLREASRSGVADRILIRGRVPKSAVGEHVSSGDIFLNTTNIDNAPVSVMEAMACGLCVVSTNVGGIPYLLDDERDALLVPPNDPEAMAGAVRRILSDPDLAERLSRNGRQKVEAFDWSAVLPQWESVLSAARPRGES